MGIHQFLGQIKAGRGMAAIEHESNRLGAKKVVRGARLGLKAASHVLPGKYGEIAGAASTSTRPSAGLLQFVRRLWL